ncbi:hypothetical protein D5674_08500 [Enterococcus faecalis]|nr:hypothetical protein [Enterococcus faecalis]
MVQIISNFIPKFYEKNSKKKYTIKSFSSMLVCYIVFITIFLLTYWSGSKEKIYNRHTIIFANVQLGILIFFVVLIVTGTVVFKSNQKQKYIVIIPYISLVMLLLLTVSYFSILLRNPVEKFIVGELMVLLLWILGTIINSILVYLSLKNNNFDIRDKYANYYINCLSILAIIGAMASTALDNINLFYLALVVMVSPLQFALTFQIPRILQYWKKESEKNENTSVYGNSIEMVKNKRTKK